MSKIRKKGIIISGLIGLLMLTCLATPAALAAGPKSIYGTLYVGGQTAAAGIDVKIKIENQTFTKKTLTWDIYNYIIGLPPGYEGKTAHFLVGANNIVPNDNISFIIGSSIDYVYDIHINNLTQDTPPRAIIDSISPNPAAYNQTVQFVGHGTDSNGHIIAYQWRSSLSGNLSANRSFNLTIPYKGNHTIYFKVQDNNNTWSPEVSQVLRITHYNRPPKATIDSVKPQRARVNSNVTFKGHGNDTDGTIVGYFWRSNRSGDIGTKASFNISSLPKGNHTIFFKVMDNTSYWSAEVQTWVFIVNNVPPTARISGPAQAQVGVPIQFDGTASNDSDGTIRAWFWEFGDGTNSTSSQPIHTFNEVRTYPVKLTVTDDSGAKANTTSQISVAEAQPVDVNNNPEKATIVGPTKGSVGTNYAFNFTASDPDFDEIYFVIEWGDGIKTTSQFTTTNQPITVNHSWAKAGTYTINVTTWDLNYGTSGVQPYSIVISDAFLGGLSWYIPVILVIIIVAIVLAFLFIRRKRSTQPTPVPMTMLNDETPAEEYPYYAEQPIDAPTPQVQALERPSGFKRI